GGWGGGAPGIGVAMRSVAHPLESVENVAATWVETAALRPAAGPSAPAIQSSAGAQDLPTTTSDAPARDEIAIAAASEPADQNQTAIGQPPAEALLKEFEAWAAKEDSRAQVVPVQPAQAAPVQVAQDAPAQAQPKKKHRR